MMKYVKLPSGEEIPALGMGTWNMGEQRAVRAEEVASLQRGVDLGMRLIDTAEMYGEGAAESLIGEAIAGRRDEVFLVSKVYPHNASLRGTVAACERSLMRLRTGCIDLYLLHWRGGMPLAETIQAFERLQQAGKIRHWGVSNLDMDDMAELSAAPGGKHVATNQVLYNLTRRGIECDLLPSCAERQLPVMAYSPIEQGRLLRNRQLADLAADLGMTAAQLALAWVLSRPGVVAIPKAARRSHVEDNAAVLGKVLAQDVLQRLDQIFPPPSRAMPLEML